MRALRLWFAALAVAGCGAKTGLPIGVADDASVEESSDAPYPCTAGTFPLERTRAELIVLLDRSGSMNENIDGESTPPRKWDELRTALQSTLPDFESRIHLGAMAYPRRFDGTSSRSCEIDRFLDVEPGPGHARAVLEILEATDPWGATPTHAALEFTGEVLRARVSRTVTVAIALATDGGPNCNPRLDASTCACTATPEVPPCDDKPSNCLDDTRTVATLAKLAALGIPTFVIGIDSATLPAERGALGSMAIAGGRPRAGEVPYYSVREPAAVTDAFRAVQRSVAECRLSMPSRPDDPDAVEVRNGGVLVPRDRTHLDGWDWASTDFGQIDFFGPACTRVGAGSSPVAIVPKCRG